MSLRLNVDGVDREATPEEAAKYWAEIPGVIEQNNNPPELQPEA